MNYLDSLLKFSPLISQYRGPTILNFAGAAGEEEEEETPAEGEGEQPEGEAPPEGEEETPEGEAGDGTGEDDEDPLATPNPYEEGSAQHDAFEHQRQKFKTKLEKETKAAAEAATAALSGKLDELLTKLSGAAPAKEEKPGEKPAPKVKLTEEDRAIVTGVLQEIGFDPQAAVRERRKQEVLAACAELRKEYPGIEFDDAELVKYANDNGISNMGGTPKRILELALLDKQKDALRTGGTTTPPAPKPTPKKKEAPPISGKSTKSSTPSPDGDKPQSPSERRAWWKNRALQKRSA